MRTVTIDDLGSIFDGPHATPTRRDRGPYFLNIASLQQGRLDLSQSDHVDEDDYAKWTRRVTPQEGDLLFSYETRLGDAAIMPSGVTACLGRRMALLRPNREVVEPRYLLYRYLSPDFAELIRANTIHGATVDRIALSTMGEWPVQVHELSEQRAIAEVLGALDDMIAANGHASGLAEGLLRAKFDQLGVIDDVGGGNAVLSELIEFQPRRVVSGEVPFIDMQAIPMRGWTLPAPSEREAKGGARFTNGDTLLARITPCLENRKTGYVDDLPDGAVGVGSTEFIVMRTREPHPLPLSFFIATDETFRAYAIQHMVGTSGRQRVSAADLATCAIHMPSPEAVHEWGQLADPLFARVRAMGRENRTLAALRDALLPELMSGRLPVKDAAKTVEEVV